jgi:hypothetical protein
MLLYQPPGKTGPPEYRDWDWGVMLTDHAWCFQCEGPAYLERVPSKQEFKIARGFRAESGVPRPPNVEDELLDLYEEQFVFLIKHLPDRRASGKCLTCGSTTVRRLQLAVDMVVNLKHPLCGGAMRLDRIYSNGFGPRTIRWFDVSGIEIGVQGDRF